MKTPQKIYDFRFDKVRARVATAFKRSGLRGTIADIVVQSGLPKYQVESVVPALVSDSQGQMAVTESGEIVYRFPSGIRAPRRTWAKKFISAIQSVLTLAFKAWIVVMLVGYFVLFVIILIAAVLASLAISAARRDDNRDDGGLLGGLLVSRVFEFFLLFWLYSGDHEGRRQKRSKPFHKAVFDFVFGGQNPEPQWLRDERRAVIAAIRERKGVYRLEELVALTGRPRGDADALMSRLLLEYEGEPSVSDDGTLYFRFPELLRTSETTPSAASLPERDLIPFTRNPGNVNLWIGLLNGFNIVLGGYFLYFSLQGFAAVQAAQVPASFVYLVTVVLSAQFFHLSTVAAGASAITWILGVVPTVYSAFFFGIPLIRRLREKSKNLQIRLNNFRRKIVSSVLRKPLAIDLAAVNPDHERNSAGKPGLDRENLKEKLVRDFVGDRSIEVPEPGILAVPELDREAKDIEQVRHKTDLAAYRLGKVIFDSEKS